MIPQKQLTLADIFEDCQEIYDSDKPKFLSLLENHIDLDGYVCKEPVYRKTPLGREIADLLIAVNRAYGKSDYIPCITWGRNARFASTLEVGQRVQLQGRIQSREYVKKISEDNLERHTAYELSASRIVLSM